MPAKTRPTVLLGVPATLGLLGALTFAPANAAGGQGGFVVDTQFWNKPSQVVSATGPYVGCTTVRELESFGDQTSTNQVTFSGTKLIKCGGDSATIGYEATVTTTSGRKTQGTWWTISATSPDLQGLSGSLTGDAALCTVAKGSGGCILDTFRVTG